jgi:RND family efflux transporter MFP subunit
MRLLLGSTLAVACGVARLAAKGSGTTPVVAAVKITKEKLTQEVSFDADLQPYEEISLHAKASGYLKAIFVEVGDVVDAGQVIAILEVPELESERERALAAQRRAQAEIRRAQAEILRERAVLKEASVARSRLGAANLAEPGLIARQDLDSAEARTQSAEATLAAAEAALAAAQEQAEVAQAEVRKVRAQLDYARVTAPFAGVITKRHTAPGALVQAGTSSRATPLVRLSQNNKLRVSFPVSLSFISRIKVGTPVEVRLPASGKSFITSVARFAQRVETATRTMAVEADLPNTDLALIPGTYATAVLKLESHPHALVAPIEAVTRGREGAAVFVVTSGGKIEERAVKLGMETPTRLEILSGLAEGDLITVGTRAEVHSGRTVEVKVIEWPRAIQP